LRKIAATAFTALIDRTDLLMGGAWRRKGLPSCGKTVILP
jgi:hypothetical protein